MMLHPASSIIDRRLSISMTCSNFYIVLETVQGVLEITAHLRKALREGSRAEPAHEGVEYAHVVVASAMYTALKHGSSATCQQDQNKMHIFLEP